MALLSFPSVEFPQLWFGAQLRGTVFLWALRSRTVNNCLRFLHKASLGGRLSGRTGELGAVGSRHIRATGQCRAAGWQPFLSLFLTCPFCGSRTSPGQSPPVLGGSHGALAASPWPFSASPSLDVVTCALLRGQTDYIRAQGS